MERITRQKIDAATQRESVLLFGAMGSGKTTAIVSLMKEFPDDKIWFIDTDAGYDKILRESYPDTSNFEILECNNMEDLIKALDTIDGEAKQNDWVVIDKLDDAWSWAQDAWSEAATGNPHIMQFLMEKNKKDGPALKEAGKRAPIFAMDQLEVWPAINFMHNFLFMDRIKRIKHNVMAVTGVRDKGDKMDDETKTIFKGIPYMPGGQKHNTHRFDTVVMMTVDLTQEIPSYRMTSIKDRGRTLFKEQRWTMKDGFWKGYEHGRSVKDSV